MVNPVKESQTTTVMADRDSTNNSNTNRVTINLSPVEIPPVQDNAPAAPTNNSHQRMKRTPSILSKSNVNSHSLHLEDLRSTTPVAKPLHHEDAQAMGPARRFWNNLHFSVMGEYNDNHQQGNVDSDEREGGVVGERGMRMYRVHHANNTSDRGCCGVSFGVHHHLYLLESNSYSYNS